MSDIKWNELKSERLKKTRGASFEDILKGKLLGVKKHPAKKHQDIMLFEYRKYIWLVPFVREKNGNIFLKTLYPSRKYTKLYKDGKL
jgi:hypothetical protein